MRLKHVLEYTRLPSQLKLFWDRVTFSKITIIYFVFSILHCFIQVFFQVQAFKINANAVTFLSAIIARGNASVSGFAVLGPDLRVCDEIPSNLDASSCPIVWNGRGTSNNAAQAPGFSSLSSSGLSYSPSSVSVSSAPSPDFVLSTPASPTDIPSSPVTQSPSSTLLSQAPLPSVLSVQSPSSPPSVPSSLAAAVSSPSAVLDVTSAPPSLSAVSSASVSKSTKTITVISTASVNRMVQQSSPLAQSPSLVPSSSLSHVPSSSPPSASSLIASPSVRTLTILVNAAAPVETLRVPRSSENDELHRKRANPQIVGSEVDDGQAEVTISGLNGTVKNTLDQKCLLALNWPVNMVEDTKREDIVFICFQIWVLAMSLVALLNESIPHIFASLLTHVIATAWAGYQIVNTQDFRSDFTRLTTQGACGVNLLPTYWKDRGHAEIPSLALNVLALLISAFLTWRLVKLFGWQTFKRVGASFIINRVYNVVLVQSIVIQLSLFFIVVSGGLWLDQIYNGAIGKLSSAVTMHKAVILLVLILLIPWLAIGWIAVRREIKGPMHIFLALSFLYLVGWAAMFAAPSFRWTFVQWKFFALMATASVTLTLTTLILGIVCRLNFGKGLARYLNADEPLEDEFSPTTPSLYYEKDAEDVEKIAFPSTDAPIPTFSAAFGRGPEVPPPSHMRFAPPRTRGPRFYKVNEDPFEDPLPNPYEYTAPAQPARTHTIASQRSMEKDLARHGSGSSQHSASSSTSSSSSGHSQNSRRWVIE